MSALSLATRTISGNNSGPYLRRPKIVVMHASRSGIEDHTDVQELGSTLNWFVNPDGASSHWVLSAKERVRVVTDDLIAWHSAYLNGRSWSMELTQPTIDRPFQDGHYDNAALVGRHYVSLGVQPVWLDYWDGDVTASGFVDHADTKQGRESGKTDPGPQFDRVRFIASLEEDMTPQEVRDIVRAMRFHALDSDGKPYSAVATIGRWFGVVNEHRKDRAKHASGGISEARARAIAQEEDKKLKVTK